MKPYTPKVDKPKVAAGGLQGAGLQGSSLFWGGVARLDVVQAPQAMRLSFCGFGLRVHRSTGPYAWRVHGMSPALVPKRPGCLTG